MDRLRQLAATAVAAAAGLVRPVTGALSAALLVSTLASVGAVALVAPAQAAPAQVARVAQAARVAARCPFAQVREHTRAARAVFVGTVTAADPGERTAGQRGRSWTQAVTVTRIYKGPVRAESTVVVTQQDPRTCSLGALAVGQAYVFFAQPQGDAGDETGWTAAGDSGTAPADTQLVAQVERLLGSGRAPVPPTREPVELTPADTSSPARLSRLAAPGAALVIVGLLGLLLVSRLARRPA